MIVNYKHQKWLDGEKSVIARVHLNVDGNTQYFIQNYHFD